MSCLSKKKNCGSIGAMLRHRVLIEQPIRTADGQGGFTEKWKQFTDCYASIEPISANQTYYSEQLQHRVTHKIFIRYLPGLASDMRIVFESRIFQVQSYRDLEERHEFYEVMAEEGKPS